MKKILSYLFFIQDNHYHVSILNILNAHCEQPLHMFYHAKDNHSHVSILDILNVHF